MTPPAAKEQREQYALKLAFATVRRFRPDGGMVDRDDLLGAAFLGAAYALAHFDPARGTKFSSYCIASIRGRIMEEVRRWDPLTRQERQQVRAGGPIPHVIVSLDAAVVTEDATSFVARGHDYAPSVVDVEGEALGRVERGRWRALVERLSTRDRRVLLARFFEGHTHQEIGDAMGVVPSRVDQWMKIALAHLKVLAEAYGLAPEGWCPAPGAQCPARPRRRRKKAQQQAPECGRAEEAVR